MRQLVKIGTLKALFSLTACCIVLNVQADITTASDTGFVSEHDIDIAATPERTYQALTGEVHRWWNAEHSYSGKPENFSLDAHAGGCFCEKLDNGGSVEHMHVVFANPGMMLRMTGGLGPLQQIPVQGVMTFNLSPASSGHTLLHYSYTVSGYATQGLKDLAGPVDQVQLGQLMRLKEFVESDDGQ